ncbi:MAG TPA: YfhO family protein [Gemmataceae bacterium]|nr:YfhO family protein [Gemmataceae bacterium]
MELAVEWIRQSRRQRIWTRLRNSEILFCTLLATFLVLTRVVAFDGRMFFGLRYIPNHDMVAGLPFFATNVHAYRTTGDIAWWNPVSNHGLGYAQYYQSFLSPVAPTSSQVLFVLWMQGIKVLSWVGITIPEYYQYLIFTYILSPFAAFFSFNLFLCRLFRSRWAILLAATAFAFSTVGLWFSAFLYFQETGTLFFLLAAWLGVVQRPTLSRAMVLLAAILTQISSINYWTIYNSWFLLLVVGSHGWIHRNQLERAWRRFAEFSRRHRRLIAGMGVGFACLAGAWLYLISTVVHEQKELYLRPGRHYSIEELLLRLEDTRWYTVEPFNPKLERATASYEVLNAMHSARYIGVAFLPLLLLVPFYRWRRKEYWLLSAAVGVFCICLASPWFLQAWKWTPGMDHVWHFFYLYPHYLMLLLILLGTAAFEKVVHPLPMGLQRWLHGVLIAALGLAVLVLLGVGFMSDHFPTHNPGFEGLTRFGGLFFLSALLLHEMVRRPQRRALLAGLFLLVAFSDLTRYFQEVNNADHRFTTGIFPKIPYPLSETTQAALEQSWPPGDPRQGLTGGVQRSLPLQMDLWPDNVFLRPFHLQEVWDMPDGRASLSAPMSDLGFVANGTMEEFTGEVTGENLFAQLLIHDRGTGTVQTIRGERIADTPFHFTRWGYNDFRLDVSCPSNGWIFLRLLYDPRWHVRVDGQPVNPSRANWLCLAFPAAAGTHHVELEYRPRARTWFWPLCWATAAALALLLILAWRTRKACAVRA